MNYCAALRLAWRRSPMYWEAMHRVKVESNQYRCEGCRKVFKLREMQVDHEEPVIDPEKGWEGMATFAARLNCDAKKLHPLCEDVCHRRKTNKENKVRRANG